MLTNKDVSFLQSGAFDHVGNDAGDRTIAENDRAIAGYQASRRDREYAEIEQAVVAAEAATHTEFARKTVLFDQQVMRWLWVSLLVVLAMLVMISLSGCHSVQAQQSRYSGPPVSLTSFAPQQRPRLLPDNPAVRPMTGDVEVTMVAKPKPSADPTHQFVMTWLPWAAGLFGLLLCRDMFRAQT